MTGGTSVLLQLLGQTRQPIVNIVPLSGQNLSVGSMSLLNYANSSMPPASSITSIWGNQPQNPFIQGRKFYTRGNQSLSLQYNIPYRQQPYIPKPPPTGKFYQQSPTYPIGNTLMGGPYGLNS